MVCIIEVSCGHLLWFTLVPLWYSVPTYAINMYFLFILRWSRKRSGKELIFQQDDCSIFSTATTTKAHTNPSDMVVVVDWEMTIMCCLIESIWLLRSGNESIQIYSEIYLQQKITKAWMYQNKSEYSYRIVYSGGRSKRIECFGTKKWHETHFYGR